MDSVTINQEELNKLLNDGWSWREYTIVGGDPDDNTYILVDEAGNKFVGVVTSKDTVFTATANDIRAGMVAATEEGVTTGTKEIPAYYVTEGFKLIPNGSEFRLYLPKGQHEYTKLQGIFCPFNTSLSNSVSAEKVVINDYVYPVQSTVSDAKVTIENDTASIHFGMANTFGTNVLIRYFTYKEVY